MWKRIAAVILLILLAAIAYIFWPESANLDELVDAKPGYDVRILRDEWGVPHVFGQTDADVAYGLAYAHAEDDFLTIQQTLLAARGDLATVYGMDAAPNDYMVHLLRIWDVVETAYTKDLSPEVRAICEAYADGLNQYAALHPEEAFPGLFPATGEDIVAGSVHKSPLFFGLDGVLGELFGEERPRSVSTRSASTGSNTLAVSPVRSANGETFLAVNSHQPWEGPVTWYEVHLHSEEGWDATGGLFPGMPVVTHGHNQNLGWAFTVNKPDLVDVYVLETNADNPNQYRFDGNWLELEIRTAPITVKILGRLKWTVEEEVAWSVYGPVLQMPHGTYALRYAGQGQAGIYEQLYRMNKAADLEEWQAAIGMPGLPMFNVGYADREGNIYYLYNGLIPVRAEGYDWSEYLPGNTSETLWTEYLPFEQLPQVLNPASGFIQNCNSTPYETTLGLDNPLPQDYSRTLGIETWLTNRARRALELLGSDPSITEQEFTTYKYDMTYSSDADMPQYVNMILSAPLPDDADVQEALELVRSWDMQATPDSRGTALIVWTLQSLDFAEPEQLEPAGLAQAFVDTVETFRATYGSVDVPWSEVNRLRRGNLDLGMGGGPDLLHAVYGEQLDDGHLQGKQGDSLVILVTWDKNGDVHSRSIHQYGSATLDVDSPHYADQAPLFVQRQLKPVWLSEAEIRAHLGQEYRPGEELGQSP
ncbi:MAG: acylase [Anaerolineae bacterium]|jgi:penicillin amidase/acyl-homoserine-lactone acylase